MRIYVGHDDRPAEREAFAVAVGTARSYGHDVVGLYADRLRMAGLLTRAEDTRGGIYDFNSGAPASTQFAISRFFVPMLAHTGWALFVDADVVFLRDPQHLLASIRHDQGRAVYVVKHRQFTLDEALTRSERAHFHIGQDSGHGNLPLKMDGQVQTVYPRKLWSSVMLFDCDHPAHQRLNLTSLNAWPGRDLHAFRWLADDEVGHLPAQANWLVGMQPMPADPIIAHYTLGTPNMPGLSGSPHAQLWRDARAQIFGTEATTIAAHEPPADAEIRRESAHT